MTQISKAELEKAFADRPDFAIYEYAVGNELRLDQSAEREFDQSNSATAGATDPSGQPAVPTQDP